MRKEAKSARRAKCSYSKCNKNPFLKKLGYYYKGLYYCSKGHARKVKKENEIKTHE